MLLISTEALAWGPGTHVETALRVLENLSLISPAIAALISKHPKDFIYGSTSPDIIVGKKYAGYHHHCHNWRMGKLILEEANGERQEAAAYGYLLHLAIDVVAHNYFVPFKMIRSFETKALSHIYWEMRFDIGVSDAAWEKMDELSTHEIEEFDELLERVLKKTLFSFSTNKKIFNSILIMHKIKGMRETLSLYAENSQWELEEGSREHYLNLSWDAAIDFLKNPEQSKVLQLDPAGIKKLEYAKNLRRRMKRMLKQHILTPTQAQDLVKEVKLKLEQSLYDPKIELPDVI